MIMTSLQKQLEKLSAPQTQGLGQDAKRASYLFDSSEAATLDKISVWNIGKAGLDELIDLDKETFSPFADSLFAETSVRVQRAVLTKEENDKLEGNLESFLLRLSPYCILRPAHKVLEWLIHRFNIHQYDVPLLMQCFLPYHDTNAFIRLLQILEIKNNDPNWSWLLPFKSAGIGPSRQALLNHAISSPEFIGFLAKTCEKIAKTFKRSETKKLGVVFTFYTSISIGAVEGSDGKKCNQIVAKLMPHLATGIKSSKEDYKLASLMILSQITVTVTLLDPVIVSVLRLLAKKMKKESANNSVRIIVLVCQTQKVEQLSDVVTEQLVAKWTDLSLLDALDLLNNCTDITAFFIPFFKALMTLNSATVTHDDPMDDQVDHFMVMKQILQDKIRLHRKCVERIIELFAEFHEANPDDFVDKYGAMIEGMEKRYPAAFQQFFSKAEKSGMKAAENFRSACKLPLIYDNSISVSNKRIQDSEPKGLDKGLIELQLSEPKKKKKRRETNGSTLDPVVEQWVSQTKKLESQFKSDDPADMQSIFELLEKSLLVDEKSPAFGQQKYIRQLILDRLCLICSNEKCKEFVREDNMRLDLIVRNIRSDQNGRALPLSLKFLVIASNLFQKKVLEQVMTILTFVGSGMVRKDDEFSFQVFHQTLDAVLPPIIKSSSGGLDKVVEIFKMLGSALPEVPTHRRVQLIQQLIRVSSEALDQSTLWILIAFLLAQHIDQWNQKKTEERNEEEEWIAEIFSDFSGPIQMVSILSLIRYMSWLSHSKEERNAQSKEWPDIFDVEGSPEKHLRHFRYVFLGVVLKVLNSDDLISKLSSEEVSTEIESTYANLLDAQMRSVVFLSEKYDSANSDNDKRYWKAVKLRSELALRKLCRFFPVSVLLHVLSDLLDRDSAVLKKNTMDLLNVRLMEHPTPFTKEDIPSLSEIVRKVASLINPTAVKTQDGLILLQSATYTMKLMTKVVGPYDSDAFVDCFENCTLLLHQHTKTIPMFVGSVSLCLGEVINCIGANALPKLGIVLPDLLKCLNSGKSKNETSELITLGVLTAIQRVVEKLSNFLSPYLPQLLVGLSLLDSTRQKPELAAGPATTMASQIQHRITQIQKYLAAISFRVLFPGISAAFATLKTENPGSLNLLFNVLSDHIDGSETDAEVQDTLTTFFMAALKFRSDLFSNYSTEELSNLEAPIISSFARFSLKLTEIKFRPLLLKLANDWIAMDKRAVLGQRYISLFTYTAKIAEDLKGLFLMFSGHLIPLCADAIEKTNYSTGDKTCFPESKASAAALLDAILNFLNVACKHDAEGFFNSARFNQLLPPLIQQYENTKLPGFEERTQNMLAIVLTELSISAKDDTCWTELNKRLLSLTRSSKTLIRVSALRSLKVFYSKIGEDVSVLVPETMPFLDELLEDGDETVESECQAVVSTIEQLIGESLQQYF